MGGTFSKTVTEGLASSIAQSGRLEPMPVGASGSDEWASLAVITGWFSPDGAWDCNNYSRTTTLPTVPRSPHPLGSSNSFVISNSECARFY